MPQADCVFCRIIKGEIPAHRLFEDDLTLAILDINPANSGHALILPKIHHNCLVETDDNDLCALILVAKEVAKAVIKVVGTDAFNIIINNGAVAGQVIPHTHIHVIPRFPGDGHEHWKKKDVPAERMKEIAEAARKNIDW